MTTLKTNNKLHPVFSYLIGCIDLEGSNTEKLHSVLIEFNRVANYDNNKRNIPNLQNRFADWLQGLPSCINVDFENYRIIEIAKEWGSIGKDATDKQEDKILDNWFNFISCKFFQLCKQNKVDYSYTY
jgi:hypothetical protein